MQRDCAVLGAAPTAPLRLSVVRAHAAPAVCRLQTPAARTSVSAMSHWWNALNAVDLRRPCRGTLNWYPSPPTGRHGAWQWQGSDWGRRRNATLCGRCCVQALPGYHGMTAGGWIVEPSSITNGTENSVASLPRACVAAFNGAARER